MEGLAHVELELIPGCAIYFILLYSYSAPMDSYFAMTIVVMVWAMHRYNVIYRNYAFDRPGDFMPALRLFPHLKFPAQSGAR